jgi:hypothetical protein
LYANAEYVAVKLPPEIPAPEAIQSAVDKIPPLAPAGLFLCPVGVCAELLKLLLPLLVMAAANTKLPIEAADEKLVLVFCPDEIFVVDVRLTADHAEILTSSLA